MDDVWSRLANSGKPVALYGMGNGADKILAVFADKGIAASAVFASDGFARGNLFHGFPVRSYAETASALGDFTVAVAFASSRPEVVANVERIAAERELVVPDVPVAGGGLFDADFARRHADELRAARALFADPRSREVFDLVCEARLTGCWQPLMDSADPEDIPGYGLLDLASYTSFADLGAYTGDTVRALLPFAPRIENIVAVEPDRRSFAKLEAFLASLPIQTRAVRAAVSDSDGSLLAFSDGAGRGSSLSPSGAGVSVPSVTLDSLVADGRVDFVKFDVEGAESAAIRGSRRTLERCRPDLRVAVYHRPEDIFAIPLAVRDMLPRHALFLRRARSFPAWDIDLFAVGS